MWEGECLRSVVDFSVQNEAMGNTELKCLDGSLLLRPSGGVVSLAGTQAFTDEKTQPHSLLEIALGKQILNWVAFVYRLTAEGVCARTDVQVHPLVSAGIGS